MFHRSRGLFLAASLAVLVAASPAAAVTVTAQIEGLDVSVPPTSTTTTGPVTRDGQTCPDGSTVSVLDRVTNGNWNGNYKSQGSSFDGPTSPGVILGESHLFGSGAYWSVYVDGVYQNGIPCDTVVPAGSEVLWFVSDDPFAPGTAGYDEPLLLSGAPVVAKPGEAFTVTVRESTTDFNQFPSPTTITPSQGATVGGATTGADGKATVTLNDRGPQQLVARKGNRTPDRVSVCVTDGNDGFCGTELAKVAEQCVTTGDDGRCGTADKRSSYGFITSLREQQRFAKGKGPRELKGRVDADPSGVKQIRLRLTRTTKSGRCSTFDGQTLRFAALSRCGAARGKWFAAGTAADWTYLLPKALGSGRYVLDVEYTDGAGNADKTLHRGRNRVVFHVA